MITTFTDLAEQVAEHIESMPREERMRLSNDLAQEVIKLDDDGKGNTFRRKVLLALSLHCYEGVEQ